MYSCRAGVTGGAGGAVPLLSLAQQTFSIAPFFSVYLGSIRGWRRRSAGETGRKGSVVPPPPPSLPPMSTASRGGRGI